VAAPALSAGLDMDSSIAGQRIASEAQPATPGIDCCDGDDPIGGAYADGVHRGGRAVSVVAGPEGPVRA